MITPRFSITQDEEFVHIKVNVSSLRFNAAGLEMVVEENVFVFHISPYYLRLRFPHNLVDDERASAKYVSQDESIEIKLPKEQKGLYFEDLDVPTKLLARQGDLLGAAALESRDKEQPKGPLIQEIQNDSICKSNDASRLQTLEQQGEAFNWEIEQKPFEPRDGLLSTKYGFDNMYDNVIAVSVSNGNDINELDDPEHTEANDRVKQRLLTEKLKFDAEYYVSEYMVRKHGSPEELEINGINEVLECTPPVVKQYLKWYKSTKERDATMPLEFTQQEQTQMQDNLPHREYLVHDVKRLYVTVLSLLFGYMFEQLECGGAHNTESAWTIGRLAPQISFLDQQLLLEEDVCTMSIIKAAVITGTRRSLSYPLHRNFELSQRAWNFVYYMLRAGKRMVCRCLLDIHEVFRFHDVYYVYNKVLVDDLCAWFLSQGNENVIRSLAVEVKKEIDATHKDDIEFDCVSGFDVETGEPTWENMTLKEMEIIADNQYRETCHGEST